MLLFAQVLISLLLCIASANYMVDSVSKICAKLGISSFVVGLILAFGTASPELVVSVSSTLKGHADINIGNVFGSYIANILVGVGLPAILTTYCIKQTKLDKSTLYLVFLTFLFVAILLVCRLTIGFVGSIVLILIFFVYIILNIKEHIVNVVHNDKERPNYSLVWPIVLMLVSAVLLVISSNFLVKYVVQFAESYGVSEKVIATTIVALGTSAPEIIAAIIAAYKKQSELSIGNIIGSNIMLLFGVFGVCGLISPVSISLKVLLTDILLMLIVGVSLYLLIHFKKEITRSIGLLFIFVYILYTVYQISI